MTKPSPLPLGGIVRFDPVERHTFMSDNPNECVAAPIEYMSDGAVTLLSPSNTGATTKDKGHKNEQKQAHLYKSNNTPVKLYT